MRVKGLVTLLTSVLISSVLPQAANAADGPSFEIKSVSSTMIDPGDTVTWKIQVNLIPGWVKDLNFILRTPSGDDRQMSVLVDPSYKVSEASSKEISLTLKTNEADLPGKYKLLYGWLYNEKEFGAYDLINYKEYATKTNMVSQDMNKFDFTIRDAGTGKQKSPQLIESIGFAKSQVDPGSTAKLNIKTVGSGVLVNANISLSTPDGTVNLNCDTYTKGSAEYCPDLSKTVSGYSFSMPVWTAEDSSPGTYRITRINLGYRNGEVVSSSNDTASWGGGIVYEDSENTYNGVNAQKLSQFEKTALNFTLLDAGQGIARAPIWTGISWKNSAVKAGSTATLIISVDGFSRPIGKISIQSLTTTLAGGDDVMAYTNQNGQEQVVRRVDQENNVSTAPTAKAGTFEVDVYVPRNAKPGSYGIGDLQLWSTSCKIPAINVMNIISSVNNLNCQRSPNGWSTAFSMGNLFSNWSKAAQWAGYVNPLSVKLEVSAADPLQAPKIDEVEVGTSEIEYRYLYSNEQSCIGSSSAGDLVNELPKDNYWTFKVINLKPDSAISLKLSCTDAAGAKAESSIDSRTSKPIPPASPKLTLDSATINSATFSIGIRDGFKYSVKVDSGLAVIQGNKVEITGLKPGIKTNLVATITDSYGQSTSTEPFYFATELPPKPTKPLLIVGKLSTTRVEFSYEKLANLDYELSVSEGEVSDIRGSVRVSGLTPNTKITASLKVTDEFGQSSISDELIVKSAVPELPAIPTLYLVKTSSDSITLRFTPRTGMKYLAKVSAGSATITDGLLVVSALKPDSKVDITFIMSDSFGQNKYSVTSYMTAPAPAQQKATKTSITCIKGKASKIITAVNPKCPSGYRKK
jgi:hypothetical protein